MVTVKIMLTFCLVCVHNRMHRISDYILEINGRSVIAFSSTEIVV